ncbi:MAG TPA: ribosome maturation factor RimM [Candidatus Binataceae bacterium]|nr:ribosome maturation factor RimM [Candidatus Binataceae bacterium]
MGAAGTDRPMLRLGRIVGAHGLKGALRIRLDNPASGALEHLARLYIEQDGTVREFRPTGASRLSPTTMRVTMEGVADATAAEALKGAIAMAAREDLPPCEPGEFFCEEAIGCKVGLADGTVVGAIEDTFSNGAHEIWVVKSNGREILIPVIDNIVKTVDLSARRMTIEAVPGLLD